MKVDGVFKSWKIGHHTATNEGRDIWICGGFSNFQDYHPLNPFLAGLSRRERRLLWREMKLEQQRRSLAAIAFMVATQ